MARLDWFLIAPSSRIAGLCHSILRGEPYSTCQLGCSYCYARWYRGPHGTPEPVRGLGRLVRSLAEASKSLGYHLPLRVATLSDPFQPAERIYKRTLRLLLLAQRYEVPIVLNTRLMPPREYRRVLSDLAGQGLLLAQVTITGTDEYWHLLRRIEPGSPSPGERLETVRFFADLGAPVMVRVQPVIPGVADRDPASLIEALAGAGADGIIIEFLRGEKALVEAVARITGARVEWEPYAAEEAGIFHPSLGYRLRVAEELWRETVARGLAFQTCKEGLFHLHTPPGLDCCGFGLLRVRTARRPHLGDIYTTALAEGPLRAEEALDRACRSNTSLLCGDKLSLLPRWLARGLALHERRLRRLLEKRPELVEKLSPALYHRDGVVGVRLAPPPGSPMWRS